MQVFANEEEDFMKVFFELCDTEWMTNRVNPIIVLQKQIYNDASRVETMPLDDELYESEQRIIQSGNLAAMRFLFLQALAEMKPIEDFVASKMNPQKMESFMKGLRKELHVWRQGAESELVTQNTTGSKLAAEIIAQKTKMEDKSKPINNGSTTNQFRPAHLTNMLLPREKKYTDIEDFVTRIAVWYGEF